MSARYDVIILGYGPVGAVLANALGQDGLSVAVVDRMLGIYDKPRAINIDHEVMRLLQSVGLADEVSRITSHHTGTEFRGLGYRLIKAFRPLQPPYPLGWPPNLMFIQPEFESILRAGAERFPGVTVLLGHEAVDFEQDQDEVRLMLSTGDGGQRTIRARYMVACDGAASPTRKRLGITQESLEFDEWWTVVDAWARDPSALPACTTQFCYPSGPTTYVVGPRGLRRWELKLLPHENPADYDDIGVVRRRMAPFVDPDAIDIWRAATYRFHALVAKDWRRGRVLLAGDSAHQMPPFMAQGLCSGIRDVANLGWKLTGVVQGQFPESVLDSYAEERKPHLRELVTITKGLGLIIGELDPAKARERDEELGRAFDAGTSETVRQKLIPDLVSGIIALDANGEPVLPAGTLFPQPEAEDGAGSCRKLDDFVGPRFLLLTLGDAPQHWLGEREAAIWDRLGGVRIALAGPADPQGRHRSLVEHGSLLADWMRSFRCEAVLVRPDKYVFGATANPQELNRYVLEIGERVLGEWSPKTTAGAGQLIS